MTRKTIGQNTVNSGGVNLSDAEIGGFDATVGGVIDVKIAGSHSLEQAISNKADPDKFVIVSKPAAAPKVEYE